MFQGMSNSDINEALEWLNPMRITCQKGNVILHEGQHCDKLCFLISGKIDVATVADDHSYTLIETLNAPTIIQPENIFGLNQYFTATVTAATECILVGIEKFDVTRLSERYEVFRLNLLNIICTRAQRRNRIPWRIKPPTIRQRIVRFIEQRCQTPAGSKTLKIKMERLATEIGDSRLNVSRALNALNAENLIKLRRAELHIPQFERLINAISNNNKSV